MTRKIYNKLVRDRIPEIIEKNGDLPKYSTLSDEDYSVALKEKLIEEARELREAPPEEVLNELSDVLELISAIAESNKLTMEEVERAKEKKAAERGGFKKALFLEYVDEN